MRTWDKVKNFFHFVLFFFAKNSFSIALRRKYGVTKETAPSPFAHHFCIVCALFAVYLAGPLPAMHAQEAESYVSPLENTALSPSGLAALQIKFDLEYYAIKAQAAAALAVLWIEPLAGHYTYSHDEQGMGYPTKIQLRDPSAPPENSLPVPLVYPPGMLKDDPLLPGESSHIYAMRTPIFIRLDKAIQDRDLLLHADLLLCSATNCLPVKQEIPLRLESAEIPLLPAVDATVQTRFAAELSTVLALPAGTETPRAAATPTPNLPERQLAVATPSTQPAAVHNRVFNPRYPLAALEVQGLAKALLFGFLAGLVLNVMPCVLPVLSLKLSGLLLTSGQRGRRARRRSFRQHNMLFSLGIISWFLILAAVLGGAGLIWGQLFQSPGVVLGLLALVFLLGLSMFGIFTLPVLDLKATRTILPAAAGAAVPQSAAPHSKSLADKAQPFFSGMFVTLLATPCSGPLLGGVLGWAFQQGPVYMALSFFAVGLGMASPYLLLAARPSLARFLPRPGAWMLTLERILGFFLMGTALYLFALLPSVWRMPTLASLLALAFSAWIWGHFAPLTAPRAKRGLVACIAVALLAGAAFFSFHKNAEQHIIWEPFQADEFNTLLGSQPLLLEFTADWCPSCKVLERTTLSEKNMAELTARYALRAIRVDMTRENPENSALLQALSGQSIPFAALFPTGENAYSPLILRDLFTYGQLTDAAQEAFGH